MSYDPRKNYVLSTVANLGGWGDATGLDALGEVASANEALNGFLDNPSQPLLQCVCPKAAGPSGVLFYSELNTEVVAPDTPEVLFIKLRPEPITPDNVSSTVLVVSMLQSPVASLYHAVRTVFAPALLREGGGTGALDSEAQSLLARLEKRLGASVRGTSGKTTGRGASGAGDDDEAAYAGILTPQDEVHYWVDRSRGGAGRGRERASRFSEIFEVVADSFGRLSELSRSEVVELVEETQNVLNDLWTCDVTASDAYPQGRMAHLMGVISGALGRYAQGSLSKLDLWTGPFAEVRSGLKEATKICERWNSATLELTGTFWSAHSHRPWSGKLFSDGFISLLAKRLQEILRVRTTFEELRRLLSPDEQRDLRVGDAFKPFARVQPLHVNEYTQPEWEQAVRGYESKLGPVETHIAGNLRRQISSGGERPQQLLRQFARFRNLLKRPTIARALAAERDSLLAQLSAYVENMDGEYEVRSGAGGDAEAARGRNLSPIVNDIVWAKGMQSRASSVIAAASPLLSDLPAFTEFKQMCNELRDKLGVFQKDQFSEWLRTTEDRLEDGELSLEMTGKLMEFDADGNMMVNYSESLVILLREVRQLSELGMSLPSKVIRAARDAETYYRYGVQLKKVANFYNTMGSQIIPVQKPMLYDTLLAFETVVQNPGRGARSGRGATGAQSITWSNPEGCQEYVDALQKGAETLAGENRKLRKMHLRLAEDVVSLMNIDLLRQRDAWKSRWTGMRDVMTQLERVYPAERMHRWKLHWDHQLYKAVEVGYRMGLESLNENLSEIKCELVFSQRQLQFRPPLEELRANYYREMKKFISIPQVFSGFGNEEVFLKMADRNAKSLVQVYRKAEILFARLAKLRDRLANWVVLGRVPDLDAYVEANVNTIAQWDANFKQLKLRRKECDKLPDFHKVDCVTVSAAPFRAAVEDQMQRLSDALVLSLRKSLSDHLKNVEDFLEQAMERLNERPHSIDEIGKAKREWKEIADKKSEIRAEMRSCDDQKKLLLSVAGSNVALEDITARLSKMPDAWGTFEVALEAFNDMIEEQREELRGNVEQEIINVNVALDKFTQRWNALKPKEITDWSDEAIAKIHDQLEEWQEQLHELKEQTATLTENCESFMMAQPKFEGLEVVVADVEQASESWELYAKYQEEMAEIASQDWITFRSRLFDLTDFAQKWLEEIKPRPRDAVKVRIMSQADDLRRAVPALKFCRGEPFKDEHWTQCFRKLGIPRGVRLDTLNVGHFLAVVPAVNENLQFLKELQGRAQGEVTIREALQELRAWSETAEFHLMEHVSDAQGGRTTALIREWKDLFTEVGDNQSLLQSLKESQYFKPFADQAGQFEVKLALLDACLADMNSIQRKWVYLEPIFGRGALPSEQARFRRIDDEFRDIMGRIEGDKRVFNLADDSMFPGLRDTLATMLDQLERCQKALSDYLEEKRSKMPRFYFIGDDDLLEILGQAKNPTVIQSHLKKLFQGVHKVEFNEAKTQINAICSVAGEVVQLGSPVVITDDVEVWLDSLAKEMVSTLSALLVECVEGEADLSKYPSQVLCLSEQVHFTNRAERALTDGNLRGLRERLNGQLATYTDTDLSSERLLQLKVKALVLDLIHHMDVVDQLESSGARTLTDWQWSKQLRFYLNESNNCVARMVDAEFSYTFEYQGNAPKLVHTPLTDKCYLTLTQGMNLGYGGNPYGPAGTGKTESVKALGAALGRQVLVFNCDEGIDFHSMGRIFTGLVKCGAWGCFDEFNRLKEDQLSAVSQQIQVIQAAIKAREPRVDLLGVNIDVDFNAGIFVTMNPAGKGYGGRSKLPDNLKQLFRPVAMSRPDNELIAEVILYSEGFSGAKDLASKMVALFTLSKQLLTPQQHYDWGLRAMKTCLNTGGNLIQNAKRDGLELTPSMEAEILIKAVRVNTLSKLTFDDAQRFLALVTDVFPGVSSEDIRYAELELAIKEVMTNKPFNLEFDEGQVRKMLQLKESLDQRMGCVIVGPSGCGKSTLWRVLQAALLKVGQVVKTYVMNPKSMPRQRLLGDMDPDTREWTDGVLTAAARQVVREPLEVRSWIVCDGDVDPEWIESLNSVLDDNHLLTMPNGERISFGSNVNFLFETHDLRFASPATISRMGMIFLSDEDVDVKRVVKCWLRRQPEDLQMNLGAWMDDVFYRALEWVLAQKSFAIETTMVGTVMNGLSHVSACASKGEFVCALIRGLGGNLDTERRSAFAKEVFHWSSERPPDLGAPLDCEFENGRFVPLAPPSYDGVFERKDLEQGTIVKTVSVLRTMNMVSKWIDNMEPFILVGPEGCGKTMLIRHLVSQRKATSVTVLHCNSQTSSEHVIRKIRQSCALFSTNSGRCYRPREGDRLVLFLKDINLPKPDKYDTCPLVAFLQQLITFQGFYDEQLEFLGIEKVHIVATMNPPTTVGRHHLSTRFTAIVRVAWMDYPSPAELTTMYSAYIQAALYGTRLPDARFAKPAGAQKLAGSMVELFDVVRTKFSVDDHRHYLFTPRDLTAWVEGLLRYDLESEVLLDVFAYEAQRLVRDRVVDHEGASRFDAILNGVLRSHWSHKADLKDVYFTSLAGGVGGGARASGGAGGKAEEKSSEGKGTEDGAADDMNAAGVQAARLTRVPAEDFKALVERGKVLYEREEKELHMLLFPEILDHVARVDRVLSKEGGSLLLVGRSGVGRRTATTLAAHMLNMEWASPNITRDYTIKNFFAELKQVLSIAGVQGEEVVLYLEDHQFTEEAILETVNSLLSSGDVPGLYTHEELEPLLAPLKEQMSEEGFRFRTPYDFFVSRVQSNLHVVLSMDPSGSDFLMRCESNPALYTRCDIQWMGEWRRSSMQAVPRLLLPFMLDKVADADATVDSMLEIHASAAKQGATPRDFITFLENYRHLYDSKTGSVEKDMERLSAGLGKLQGAAATVDQLSREAGEQQVLLSEKQQAADEAMTQITQALEMASDRRKDVEVLSKEAAIAERDTTEQKADIEEQLSGIAPILESAKEAVGAIKSDHLNEIRSLKMPPEPIADVLSAVLMLLGVDDTSWLSMKKFLGKRGVKDDILAFDARRITPDIRKNVSKVLKAKSSSFDAKTIQRVSLAAAPMAAWVKANIRYSLVLTKIQPLEQELGKATATLRGVQNKMEKLQKELQEIDDNVARMKDEFARRTAEAESLKIGLKKTEQTLSRAENLLGKLSGEKGRWEETCSDLERQIKAMPTHILLAAGFVTYLAKSSEDVRSSMVSTWEDMCGVKAFDFKRLMSSESELLTFKAAGLPADELSMENAVVILESEQRVPFIIDPATTATSWLERHLAADESRPLESVAVQDQRFQTQVELAVRFGKSLLIKEVDRVEPMLFPLVRRDLVHQGPRLVVQIGEKQVDFNEKFRMFMVTRNPRPDIPADAASLITEVNFTVTRSGLEGQLLGVTLQHEQPELETRKSELLQKEEELKVQLAGLEKTLLEELASSTGDILENQKLIDSLTETKTKSADIAAALEGSEKASVELDRQRDVYRPFAKAGSSMFFLVRQIESINNMYQFSLGSFVDLFRATLAERRDSGSVEERIRRLIPALQRRVLVFVGRSLFKADRLMFALHFVHGMLPDQFGEHEWEYFVGDLVADLGARARGFPEWAAPDRETQFALFGSTFPSLLGQLNLSDASWERWARSPIAEREWPSALSRSVTAFQRVLIIQTLRPDRLVTALQQFVCEALAVASVAPPPTSLAKLHDEEMTATVPVLMITTTGADPSKDVEEFAAQKVGRAHYQELAMGGGQQDVAIKMLRKAAQAGDWLMLKNLHLVTPWLTTLEKEINSVGANPRFRLFLTTEAHDSFPPILLQQSLKVTYEAPPGLRKNLERTYEAWNPEYISKGTTQRAQVLFVLAFFHAIVQERRTYVPQGWTKAYEFSFADLRTGAGVIDELMMGDRGASGQVPWVTIHGLMENAIYGGRVDNTFDFRVLRAYLEHYFTPDMLSGRRQLARGLSLPASTEHRDYMELIGGLGDTDSPQMFMLPDNIERSVQRAISGAVVTQLKLLRASSAAGGGFDRERWRAQLGPLLELWSKVTTGAGASGVFDSADAEAEAKDRNLTSRPPVEQFTVMEHLMAARLVQRVDEDIKSVKKVVYGTALLTPEILATATALLAEEVPRTWASKFEGPEQPQKWLRAVVVRRLQLAKWAERARSGDLLRDPLDLNDLFRPATFLNALRQQTAREAGISMDALRMVSCFDASLLRGAPLVIHISGLFLQGAEFNGRSLRECASDASELIPIDDAVIAYVGRDFSDPYPSSGCLAVPVYHSPDREHFLTEITVPITGEKGAWVLAGCAMFLGDD